MNTSRRRRHERIDRLLWTKCRKTIRTPLRGLRAALIGLLLIFVVLTSGCGSRSNLPVAPQDLTVDASLMVPSNYTSQLLEALSK